jgi:D-glycero-D-manno-heptose 1,7-bisphosphate phosphatase
MNKAFFLDRDGTINYDVHYLRNVDDVKIIEGVKEAIKLIHKFGYKVIVVTNQGGIAKGLLTEETYQNINNKIQELLNCECQIDAFFYCPHHPDITKCVCRKPNPFLLKLASKQFDIDLTQSYMIGDKLSDIETGINANCKESVLVLTGHGKKYELKAKEKNIKVYDDLYVAVKSILDYNE